MAWNLIRAQRRLFSSTARQLGTYGFIGLGQMVRSQNRSMSKVAMGLANKASCIGLSNGQKPPVEAPA